MAPIDNYNYPYFPPHFPFSPPKVPPPPPKVAPPPPPHHSPSPPPTAPPHNPVTPPPPFPGPSSPPHHPTHPPPPPHHPISPPPPPHHPVFPPPPPHHPVFPPPPPHHPFSPPPPPHHPVFPPPPAPTPGHHSTVIVVVFVSMGGLFFLAFLSVALCCFIKQRKKRMVQKTEIVDFDEHVKVQEAIVPGPHGEQMKVMTIEEDIHIEEKIGESEKASKGSHILSSHDRLQVPNLGASSSHPTQQLDHKV